MAVDLIKDGKVVDTIKLSSEDSWKATFEVDDDGDYDINVSDISGYSSVIAGNADKGFVITNSLMKSDVLDSVDTPEEDNFSGDEVLANSFDNDSLGSSAGSVLTANDSVVDGNSSGNKTNSTPDTNSTENNSTENNNSTDDDNSTDDSDDSESVTTTTTTTTTTKVITKDNKNPTNNTTTTGNKNTGFPLAVLVVALFIVAFIPFTRKK